VKKIDYSNIEKIWSAIKEMAFIIFVCIPGLLALQIYFWIKGKIKWEINCRSNNNEKSN